MVSATASCLLQAGVIYVMTHDSIGLGEDGPTHQPIEHLASFRCMPNVLMLRPGDGNETAGAYKVLSHLSLISLSEISKLVVVMIHGPQPVALALHCVGHASRGRARGRQRPDTVHSVALLGITGIDLSMSDVLVSPGSCGCSACMTSVLMLRHCNGNQTVRAYRLHHTPSSTLPAVCFTHSMLCLRCKALDRLGCAAGPSAAPLLPCSDYLPPVGINIHIYLLYNTICCTSAWPPTLEEPGQPSGFSAMQHASCLYTMPEGCMPRATGIFLMPGQLCCPDVVGTCLLVYASCLRAIQLVRSQEDPMPLWLLYSGQIGLAS